MSKRRIKAGDEVTIINYDKSLNGSRAEVVETDDNYVYVIYRKTGDMLELMLKEVVRR